MKDIENTKKEAPLKESPFLGLQGMGGGATSLMWAGGGATKFDLFVWGSNTYGSLGLNQGWRSPNGIPSIVDRSSPTQIPGDWYGLYGGNAYYGEWFLGTKEEEGTLWSWGRNSQGQLGHNECDDQPHKANKSSPTQIGTDSNWVMAGRSEDSFLALKDDNTLWGCGAISPGLIGIYGPGPSGVGASKSSPTQLTAAWTQSGKTWVADSKKWSINRSTYFLINSANELWCWGMNYVGQLGQNYHNNPQGGNKFSSPIQIPGSWATCDMYTRYGGMGATKTDGTCWVWGNSSSGYGKQQDISSPTQIPGSYYRWTSRSGGGYLVKQDDTLWYTGYLVDGAPLANNGQPLPILPWVSIPGSSSISSPIQVGASYATTPAFRDGWSRQIAFSSGSQGTTTYALQKNGNLWAWGANVRGELGLNQEAGQFAQPWIPASNKNRGRSSPAQIPGVWGNVVVDDTKDYIVYGKDCFAALKKQ